MGTLLALNGGWPVRELPRRGATQESGRTDAFSRAGDGSGRLASGGYVTAKLPTQWLLAARRACRIGGFVSSTSNATSRFKSMAAIFMVALALREYRLQPY